MGHDHVFQCPDETGRESILVQTYRRVGKQKSIWNSVPSLNCFKTNRQSKISTRAITCYDYSLRIDAQLAFCVLYYPYVRLPNVVKSIWELVLGRQSVVHWDNGGSSFYSPSPGVVLMAVTWHWYKATTMYVKYDLIRHMVYLISKRPCAAELEQKVPFFFQNFNGHTGNYPYGNISLVKSGSKFLFICFFAGTSRKNWVHSSWEIYNLVKPYGL